MAVVSELAFGGSSAETTVELLGMRMAMSFPSNVQSRMHALLINHMACLLPHLPLGTKHLDDLRCETFCEQMME